MTYGIRYKGVYVTIERDPHESMQMYMTRFWWVAKHYASGKKTMDELIDESREYANKKLLGVQY